MDEQLPGRWIGWGAQYFGYHCPQVWQAWAYFLGYFKDYGYTTPIPQSMKELWGQISDVATGVDASLLWHNWEDFQCCLATCFVIRGANIQYVWQKLEVSPYMFQVVHRSSSSCIENNVLHNYRIYFVPVLAVIYPSVFWLTGKRKGAECSLHIIF